MDLVDPQRRAVYAWESAWGDWERQSLKMTEIRATVRKACRSYGVPPPAVRAHKGGMWTTYTPEPPSVTFKKSQRNMAVALHEAAHHILFAICKQEIDEESDGNFEDHGPEWLGIYLRLLAKGGVAPLVALTASARKAGLKFLTVEASEPLRLRRLVETKLS